TGMGRTGAWFAFQHAGIQPDVMTLAKALANGVPIGACLAQGVAGEMLSAGKHASTFGGNPLACSAALAVIDTLESGHWIERVAALGNRLLAGFRARLGHHPAVVDIRGLGLMIGIELNAPCADLVAEALARGYLINVTADTTVRLLPPFILNDQEETALLNDLSTLITEYTAR
ncbi:aminotransferase class III-fold pyridoxal phosphate-dependent enzyme, partial [Candidatus Woesearchaeota archaeon]|nr:aminotransferase class III-fold pyridoxal phosphate-dependent enzyme [Candidatus Woesearchaeota archaeon]